MSVEPPVATGPAPVYTAPAPSPQPVHTKPSPLPPLITKAAPVAKAAPMAKAAPQPVPVPYREPPPPPARHVTLEPGIDVAVRVAQSLSAEKLSVGEVFRGVLSEPLIAEGLIVGERGAQVTGRVIGTDRGALTLRLLNFQTADGQRIEISTEPVSVLSGNALRFRITAKVTITERHL